MNAQSTQPARGPAPVTLSKSRPPGMFRLLTVWLLLFLVLSISGCISSTSRPATTGYDLSRTGEAARLADALSDKRAVFIGETHTRMDHHRLQLRVIEALHEAGRDLAIGVEWIQHPFQPVLDDFIAGRIDEAEMLHRTGYFERWRFDYRLYRDIVRYAHDNGIPLVALNAPKELTEAISAGGLSGLPPELRSDLPSSYDRSNTAYATTLKQVFEMHDIGGDASFERFLDVQLTWDESMAEQVADYLAAHPSSVMVVLAGAGHVIYGAGIPDRVQRRMAVAAATVLPADIGSDKPGSADILVATEPQPLAEPGLLGVFLRGDAGGLVVTGFSNDSGAREAGLAVGDRVVAVNGRATPHLAALKLALIDQNPGDRVDVDYLRPAPKSPVTGAASVVLH